MPTWIDKAGCADDELYATRSLDHAVMKEMTRMRNATTRRSWLVVPASAPVEIERAARCGASVVVLDLVEFVAERDKIGARSEFRTRVAAARAGGAEVFAQVAPRSMGSDLPACVCPGLAGIVLSRVESPAEMKEAACVLDELESERGIAPATLQIVAALETAAGNHAAYDIVRASGRVWGATLGRADLVMDLRPEPSGEIHLMPYLMQRLVIVAGAAGITPIGAWWRAPDRGLLSTPENTYEAARRGRAIGFKGAMCLRLEQVDALNRAFGAAAMDTRARQADAHPPGIADSIRNPL